jgi:hypothetical protein
MRSTIFHVQWVANGHNQNAYFETEAAAESFAAGLGRANTVAVVFEAGVEA